MNLKIGVDVDGVLADFNTAFIKRVIAVTGRDLFPPRPFDIPCWNYPEHYGYTPEENTRVWQSIEQDVTFWQNLPPYPDTKQAMNYLRERDLWAGDDVYFVTSRPGLYAKRQTEQWLRGYYYPQPTVLISSKKGLCATALTLDVYIDDRWENAVDTSAHTKTFLMNRPWNREYNAAELGILRTDTVVGFVEAPVAAGSPPA